MRERLTHTNKNTNLSVPRKLLYDFYMNDNDFALLEEIVNKLGDYEQLEEDGLLLRLPCKVGDVVYYLQGEYTKCSYYDEEFDDYNCQGCEEYNCDSEYYYEIKEIVVENIEFILHNFYVFKGKYFLTREGAELKLKEK